MAEEKKNAFVKQEIGTSASEKVEKGGHMVFLIKGRNFEWVG